MHSFSVNSLSDKERLGLQDLRSLSTGFTSQVEMYLGTGGFCLKTPFMNLEISGCVPIHSTQSVVTKFDSADLAVFKEL